jgi:twitching motility protein PilT
VLTVEDPIEFVHEPKKAQVTQREIGEHAASFAAAMRNAGREDPNVVFIGELRNNETTKLAFGLASQGVLVFATAQTTSATATIDRMVNAFPAEEQPHVRGMLADALVAIVAQQLLKAKDGHGRVAVLEVLVATSAVGSMIRENKTFQIPSVMQSGQNAGMQTMDMALERLLAQAKIAPEEALEVASDKEAMARIVARTRPDLVDAAS